MDSPLPVSQLAALVLLITSPALMVVAFAAAVRCSEAGMSLHCPQCSAPLRWKYQDCIIPLVGLESDGSPDRLTRHGGALSPEFADSYKMRILRQLRREADAGWEPAEATDFPAVWAMGQVQVQQYHRLRDWIFGGASYRYLSVTMRLRRLVPH